MAPNFALGAVLMQRFAARRPASSRRSRSSSCITTGRPTLPAARRSRRLRAAARREGGRGPAPGVGPRRPGRRREGIRLHSVRLPGLVAHQEVIFGGPGQTLTIRHDSMDRTSFMPGVLLAIRRVPTRPGLTVGLDALLDPEPADLPRPIGSGAMDLEIRTITYEERPEWVRAVDTAFSSSAKDDEVEASLPVVEPDRPFAAIDGGRIVGTSGCVTFRMMVPGGRGSRPRGVTDGGRPPHPPPAGINTAMMRVVLDQAAGAGRAARCALRLGGSHLRPLRLRARRVASANSRLSPPG